MLIRWGEGKEGIFKDVNFENLYFPKEDNNYQDKCFVPIISLGQLLLHSNATLELSVITKMFYFLGFSGGAVVKNLPANAGDMGSSPGLRRSHMQWSK